MQEERSSLREQLTASCDLRGQLELEVRAKALLEGRDRQHVAGLAEAEAKLKERAGELEALRRTVQVEFIAQCSPRAAGTLS